MHDSLYVVAHFHLMLSGAVVMGIFIGFYYYYFSLLQLKYSKLSSFAHIMYYTIGQWVTFIPLFWLAFSGLPRRLHDFPLMYIGWQSVATAGHFTTMLGVFFFYTTLFESALEKKLIPYLHNLIPRLYNDSAELKLKNLVTLVNFKSLSNITLLQVQKVIQKNNYR